MKNEEYLRRYKESKDKAYLDLLYYNVEKMLWKIAHEYNCDIDEMYLGFMKAVNSYDESKGKFTSYCYACCKNSVLMERRKKHLQCDSLDLPYADGLKLEDMIEDSFDFAKDYENKELVKQAMSFLNDKEKYVVKAYYIDGRKQEEIAQELGCMQNNISRILTKALNKMKGGLQC